MLIICVWQNYVNQFSSSEFFVVIDIINYCVLCCTQILCCGIPEKILAFILQERCYWNEWISVWFIMNLMICFCWYFRLRWQTVNYLGRLNDYHKEKLLFSKALFSSKFTSKCENNTLVNISDHLRITLQEIYNCENEVSLIYPKLFELSLWK